MPTSGTPATPTTDRPRAPARRRLLDAAGDLFYTNGINTTGVDAIIATADVARMTFYKQFGSKDGLVAAYLAERDQRWRTLLELTLARTVDRPPARLLAVFDALEQWIARESFRGCSFANAAAELPDADHPARAVIATGMHTLRERMRELAEEGGYERPAALADQLLLLYEGALATTALGAVAAGGTARTIAARLLGVDEPSA